MNEQQAPHGSDRVEQLTKRHAIDFEVLAEWICSLTVGRRHEDGTPCSWCRKDAILILERLAQHSANDSGTGPAANEAESGSGPADDGPGPRPATAKRDCDGRVWTRIAPDVWQTPVFGRFTEQPIGTFTSSYSNLRKEFGPLVDVEDSDTGPAGIGAGTRTPDS